ncbi:MAG: hypothetical protein LBP59_00915 [Planctomycetaceae bacterium]|nr:hypothetical protein [Planctomycetaceae bacterium]
MLSLTGHLGQIFIVTKNAGSRESRLHPRIAGVSPACGCTQPPLSEVKITSAFLFTFRQIAGGTPAIRWSRLRTFRRFFVTKNCFLNF